MTQVVERTVLFADLRGSTSMYETLGNADATAVVTRSVALLARIVAAPRRPVVKTLGDGLMAVFDPASSPPPATCTARWRDARATIASASADAAAERRQRARRPCRRPRAAASCRSGSRTARWSRCRATSSATPSTSPRACSTTPATTRRSPRSSVVDALGEWERVALSQPRPDAAARPRRAGARAPAGAVRRFGDTAATAYGDMLGAGRREPEAHPPGLARPEPHLRRHEPAGRCSAAARRRPTSSTTPASRARTRGSTGTAAPSSCTDLSYNGTYVRFDNEPEIISLRRGACTLHGSGVIGLGTPPTEPVSPCVRFEVMQLRRHAAPGAVRVRRSSPERAR